MVDILLYCKPTKPRRYRGFSGFSKNYLCYRDELEGGKHPVKTKEEKRTAYEYPVKIVSDPLEVGGFKPGSVFSAVEYREMKNRYAFTPGTILEVRGVLRVIRKWNGVQIASKVKPIST